MADIKASCARVGDPTDLATVRRSLAYAKKELPFRAATVLGHKEPLYLVPALGALQLIGQERISEDRMPVIHDRQADSVPYSLVPQILIIPNSVHYRPRLLAGNSRLTCFHEIPRAGVNTQTVISPPGLGKISHAELSCQPPRPRLASARQILWNTESQSAECGYGEIAQGREVLPRKFQVPTLAIYTCFCDRVRPACSRDAVSPDPQHRSFRYVETRRNCSGASQAANN